MYKGRNRKVKLRLQRNVHENLLKCSPLTVGKSKWRISFISSTSYSALLPSAWQ